MKKLIALILTVLTVLSLCSCSLLPSNGTGSPKTGSPQNQGQSGGETLQSGKWPSSVYSKYGIDEISTKGKIVYTEFPGEGSYQYGVYYSGVTREELVSWTDGLFAKGFRISDRDKERLSQSVYDYDVMVYCPGEKQPYRMRIAFDFGEGMDFEYYSYYDEPDPNFTVVERTDDYGETHAYIEYDLKIDLNPMNNTEEFEREFPSLGLVASDLKGVNGVRKVSMGEASYMSSVNFIFYTDHVTSQEETEECRKLLIDKLGEKGAKFFDGLDLSKELSAAELKDSGKSSYYVQKDGVTFMLMVDPDSAYGDFGDSYGVVLTKTK